MSEKSNEHELLFSPSSRHPVGQNRRKTPNSFFFFVAAHLVDFVFLFFCIMGCASLDTVGGHSYGVRVCGEREREIRHNRIYYDFSDFIISGFFN